MLLVEKIKIPNSKIVSFSLKENELACLIGKNGSGKSLFLKSLANLIPNTYEKFIYQNKNISEWNPQEFRQEVFYSSSIPFMPLDGNVEDFMTAHQKLAIYSNVTPTFDPLPYLNDWKLSGEKLIRLSSGQRQMVSLLRALTLKSKILLLDEPTSHLDPEKTLQIEKLIHEWREQTQGSILLVSHQEAQINRMNGKVYQFENLLN